MWRRPLQNSVIYLLVLSLLHERIGLYPEITMDSSMSTHTMTGWRKKNRFRAHNGRIKSLAIHSTRPYLLSSSDDRISLWNWDLDCKIAQVFFTVDCVRHIEFNAKDTMTFFNSCYKTGKFQDLDGSGTGSDILVWLSFPLFWLLITKPSYGFLILINCNVWSYIIYRSGPITIQNGIRWTCMLALLMLPVASKALIGSIFIWLLATARAGWYTSVPHEYRCVNQQLCSKIGDHMHMHYLVLCEYRCLLLITGQKNN